MLSTVGSILPYILQGTHLGIVVLLINKNWRKPGLLISFSVLLVLVYILKFAPSIPCSCIALIRGMNWNDQLYFNFIALAINIIGLATFLLLQRAPCRNQATFN
ncbi:MauE/DoxX family redox-associated membrane protein [Elizabethkingia ursingii]|uniref:MauE/DoxX family redox-associated membrane protein n=1 Tax=Elizabethkingia ursingii TaxID=1756150 RepID=UPI003D80A92C